MSLLNLDLVLIGEWCRHFIMMVNPLEPKSAFLVSRPKTHDQSFPEIFSSSTVEGVNIVLEVINIDLDAKLSFVGLLKSMVNNVLVLKGICIPSKHVLCLYFGIK